MDKGTVLCALLLFQLVAFAAAEEEDKNTTCPEFECSSTHLRKDDKSCTCICETETPECATECSACGNGGAKGCTKDSKGKITSCEECNEGFFGDGGKCEDKKCKNVKCEPPLFREVPGETCVCKCSKDETMCADACSGCGNGAKGCTKDSEGTITSCDCGEGFFVDGVKCEDEKCLDVVCEDPFIREVSGDTCVCKCSKDKAECADKCATCGDKAKGCEKDKDGKITSCACAEGFYDNGGKCEDERCKSVKCSGPFTHKIDNGICECSCSFNEMNDRCNGECDSCGSGAVGCMMGKDHQLKCFCDSKHYSVKGACISKVCEGVQCPESLNPRGHDKICVCECNGTECSDVCNCGDGSIGCRKDPDEKNKRCYCESGKYDKGGHCADDPCESFVACQKPFEKKIKGDACMCNCNITANPACNETCKCGPGSLGCIKKRDNTTNCICKPTHKIKKGKCEVCDCGTNSTSCSFKEDGNKTCTCKRGSGFNGDSCIDCKCGDRAEGCTLKGGKTVCICDGGYQELDGFCKECDCGPHGRCSFKNGKKTCECGTGYAEKDGICVDCDCGTGASGCKFSENNSKICHCNSGFADLDGKCKECFCGEHSNGCKFEKGKKVCDCKANYTYDGETCALCYCGKNGKCSFKGKVKYCDCDKGYGLRHGVCESCECGNHTNSCSFDEDGNKVKCFCEKDFAYDGTICRVCECGALTDTCEFNEGKKECSCRKGSAIKDSQCTECNCGNSTGCNFGDGGKKCFCNTGFAQLKGRCEACDCGEPDLSCAYTEKGKICKCKQDHAQKEAKCEKCECGENSKGCSFKNNVKTCECDRNYAQKDQTCAACECGAHSEGCVFNGNTKKCKCVGDYADLNGKCESCKLDIPCTNGECAFAGKTPYCQCKEDHTLINGTCKMKQPCAKNPCVNGTCTEKDNLDYECVCYEGFSGVNCSDVTWCKEYGYKLCPEGKCKYNKNYKTGTCDCPKNKYFDMIQQKCVDVDNCSFVTCNNNQTCENGKCDCKPGYEKKGDLCIYDACSKQRCGKNEDCQENARDINNPLCTCKNGYYYDGKECRKSSCDIPGASTCSQICILTDTDCRCDCFPGFKLADDKKSCTLVDAKSACSSECKAGPKLKGQCILEGGKPSCKCPPGYLSTGDRCELNAEKFCPGGKYNETTGSCICEKTLRLSKDQVTCERTKLCDSKKYVDICEKRNGFCVDTSDGFDCQCRGGMAKDEKGFCKSLCDLPSNDCASQNKQCEVVLQNNQYRTQCRCPLAFDQTKDQCNSFAKNSYLLSSLPISKMKYPGDPNTDVGIRAKLLEDLDESMKRTFPDLDDVSLVSCTESGKELLCKIELQFKQKQNSDLAKRLQLPEVCVSDAISTDLCLVPPSLLLKKADLPKVPSVHTEFCTEDVKDKYCGKLARCKKNRCTCGDGYRTVFSRLIGGAHAAVCEDIDECAAGPNGCANTTNCANSVGSYYCECKPGHKKPKGKEGHNQVPCIDICAENVCGQGTCAKKGDFTVDCTCKAGYSGSFCDKDDKNYKGAKHQVVVVGVVLAVLLAISLIALFVLYRRFKQNRYSQDFTPNPRNTEAAEMMERRNLRQGVSNRGYDS